MSNYHNNTNFSFFFYNKLERKNSHKLFIDFIYFIN